MTTRSQPSAATREPSLEHCIGLLSGLIGSAHYPNADRAALKRWAPGQPIPLAFYRLWLRHVGDDLPPEGQTEAWMTLAWGLALCGPGGHRPGRPLGQALAESGFAEGRLERLLSSPADMRIELFTSAARFLAAKGEAFDWAEAAQFLLTHDADKREAIHRRIAAAYYRSVSHANTKE